MFRVIIHYTCTCELANTFALITPSTAYSTKRLPLVRLAWLFCCCCCWNEQPLKWLQTMTVALPTCNRNYIVKLLNLWNNTRNWLSGEKRRRRAKKSDWINCECNYAAHHINSLTALRQRVRSERMGGKSLLLLDAYSKAKSFPIQPCCSHLFDSGSFFCTHSLDPSSFPLFLSLSISCSQNRFAQTHIPFRKRF